MFLRSSGIAALDDYKMLKSGKRQYEVSPLQKPDKLCPYFLIIHSGFASPTFFKTSFVN